MKKLFRVMLLLCLVAIGIFAGYLIYTKTGIVKLVENKNNETEETDVIAKINGMNLTVDEARAYYASMKNQIEAIYGKEIWNYKLSEEGESYEKVLKDRLLEKIIYIKLVCANATAEGVSLDSEDMADVSTYITDFFASISEETAKKYNLSPELMSGIYSENVLAGKVYDHVTLNHDVDANTSNCRQAEFLKLEIKKYYLSDNDEPVYYTAEELSDLKTKVASAYLGVKNADFKNIALSFVPDADPELICGRDDLPASIADKVMALKEGEVSDVLETNEFWAIYKCVREIDEDATNAAIQKKVNDERNAYFERLYQSWYASAAIDIERDKWENLE